MTSALSGKSREVSKAELKEVGGLLSSVKDQNAEKGRGSKNLKTLLMS